jgi:membrane-associated protein
MMTTHLLDPVQAAVDWLFTLDPVLVYAVTGLFTALETTAFIGLVVPGDAVALLAGSTVTNGLAYAAVIVAATLGSLAGETGGYLLGRLVGPRLRHSRLGRRLGEERWSRAQSYLNGDGARALVAVRFVAVLHAVVPLVAGTVRMPYRRFAGWSALGALAWSTLFTTVGMLAGSAYRQYDRVGLVVTGTVLAAFALGGLLKRLAGRSDGARARRARKRDARRASGRLEQVPSQRAQAVQVGEVVGEQGHLNARGAEPGDRGQERVDALLLGAGLRGPVGVMVEQRGE